MKSFNKKNLILTIIINVFLVPVVYGQILYVPGNKFEDAIIVSDYYYLEPYREDFSYDYWTPISDYTDNFRGTTNNDIFFTFAIDRPMAITITHCGSNLLASSYIYVLRSLNDRVDSCVNCITTDCGLASLKVDLYSDIYPVTFYVVSEWVPGSGSGTRSIQTNISGKVLPKSDGNEFEYPIYPDTYSTNTEEVGSIPGSFGVSATGASTYSMPIECPVGVGGLQPQLAITYNSQAGNGVVGYGTGISGISVITRGPKTIYHDTNAKGITFIANDAYYLDGQRLIYSSGSTGIEGCIYYPESDPYTIVTVRGTYSGTTCNTWFEVLSKDGIKYYYGNNTTSRQKLSGGETVSWYLDKVEDPIGNIMTYTYSNNDGYYVYLTNISYGGNTIELNYATRTDVIPFVIKANNGSINKRLTSITTKTGNSKYREYILGYKNDDHFSRLSSAILKNGNGNSLRASNFEWKPFLSLSLSSTSPSVTSATYSEQCFMAVDINGDGISDLVGIYSSSIGNGNYMNYARIYRGSLDSNGNPQFNTNSTTRQIATTNGIYKKIGDFNQVDYDGDGKYEVVVPVTSKILNQTTAYFYLIGDDTNRGIFSCTYYNDDMPEYTTGDMNNDGRGDFILIDKSLISNKYYCWIVGYKNNIESKVGEFQLSLPSNGKPQKIFVADFDGDGLNDVLIFNNNGYAIFWNQGNDINNSTLSDNNKKTVTDNNFKFVDMIQIGDFNGDGLPDFITNASNDPNWYFLINNGDGTFTKQIACSLNINDNKNAKDKFSVIVLDFNNDGKSDVIINKAKYSYPLNIFLNTYTYWMRSTGAVLTQVTSTTSTKEQDAENRFLVAGDFRGNGQTELMHYGYNMFGATGTTQQWRVSKNNNYDVQKGKIIEFKSGFGAKIQINYASFVSGGIYTKGTGNSYPIVNITPPLHAVKTVSYVNSYGTTVSKLENYNYSGLKVHLQGKGLIGLMSKTVTTKPNSSSANWFTVEEGITSFNTLFYVPNETFYKTTIDNKTAETKLNFTVFDKGSKKYFMYPNTKTEKDLDQNTNTTTYTFNTTNGYITEEKTIYGSSSMYKQIKYENYTKVGGSYKPQLVTLIQKHSDDGNTFTNKTGYNYNSTKGYITQMVENKDTDKELTTNYSSYDAYGNLKTYSVNGPDITTVTYQIEYEATNRFVKKRYTSPASSVFTYLYDIWGNVTDEKDETESSNIQLIKHTYNGWGRRTSTILPDGQKTTYKTGWNYFNDQKTFYTITQGKGEPWVKKWYDRAGRETFIETVGPKGLNITVSNEYNNKGQLNKTESIQGDLTITDNYTYDVRGRIATSQRVQGQSVSYSYGNRSVTQTTNGNSYVKTYDAWGNIKTSTDPASSVTYSYKSIGKPGTIVAGGSTFTMDYDNCGNQKELVDPDAGKIEYTYDALGRLKTQKDARNNTTSMFYDNIGRLNYTTTAGTTTNYTYGTSGNNKNRLTKIKTDNNFTDFVYNKYGQVQKETRTIDGSGSYAFSYNYNDAGKIRKIAYPTGNQIIYEYDPYGNLIKVLIDPISIAEEQIVFGDENELDGGPIGGIGDPIIVQPTVLWELINETGTITTSQLGDNSMTSTVTRNAQGFLTNIQTVKSASPTTQIHNMSFAFNAATGNLTSRSGMLSQSEFFGYDNVDRLKTVNLNSSSGTLAMSTNYQANGNIFDKKDLGAYIYHTTKKHAVTQVENTGNIINTLNQVITYNAFNKVSQITETIVNDAYQLNITYGPDQQRWKTEQKKNGVTTKTIIFAKNYEKVTENGVTKEMIYLPGGCIYVKQSGQTNKMYFAHTDHLGSIVKITDKNGVTQFTANYDAWGKQTITNSTFKFHRGYTGHEHLTEFGLINMNGRMYDYNLGRFLSPDPYVQALDFSQSYNRYSYAMNNPLIYTDPEGEAIVAIIIGVVVFAAIEYGTQVYQNYQINQQMKAAGQDVWSNKDIWLKKIDWFDVGVSGLAGGLSTVFPVVAPIIKYATPVVQNAFNWYGDGTFQTVFDGSIPIKHYAINTGLDLATTYLTSKFHQYNGLYGSNDGIKPNPNNSDWYYSWRGNYLENALYSTLNSTIEYTFKSRTYFYFNYYEKLPVEIPYDPINYKNVENRCNVIRYGNYSDKKNRNDIDLRKYLNLSLIPIR